MNRCTDKYKRKCMTFRDRNYPPYLIRDVQRQVGYHTRPNIITQKEREQCPYDTFLVTECTPDLDVKKLKSIIRPNPTRGMYQDLA